MNDDEILNLLCPKCKSGEWVVPKLLLIGKQSPDPELCGYQRVDQLAVDELVPECVKSTPLEQFVEGYFCTLCGVGLSPMTSSNGLFYDVGRTGGRCASNCARLPDIAVCQG